MFYFVNKSQPIDLIQGEFGRVRTWFHVFGGEWVGGLQES